MNRSFNKALNKESTIYGLVITGLIFGAVGSVIAILKLGIMWFVLGAVPGYIVGVIFSNYWHQGKLQRWLYWNTPLLSLLRGKKLPPSWQRWFL
jgi:uncharacterized membrane protein YoaK (UPF0700 family)